MIKQSTGPEVDVAILVPQSNRLYGRTETIDKGGGRASADLRQGEGWIWAARRTGRRKREEAGGYGARGKRTFGDLEP
jgi:hypothetical protein